MRKTKFWNLYKLTIYLKDAIKGWSLIVNQTQYAQAYYAAHELYFSE